MLNLRTKTRAHFMLSVQKMHPFFRGSTEQKYSEKETFPEWCFHLSLQKGQRKELPEGILCWEWEEGNCLGVVNCKAYWDKEYSGPEECRLLY